jgi:16S rRNA (uracil1498-N3)-methyltransferase
VSEPLFYRDSLADVGNTITLSGDEAHHALASRRLSVGDALWLFDGKGKLARTKIAALRERRELDVVIETLTQQPSPAPRLHLICALPKGDRAAVLIDMTTQLGIASFTPLLSARSVVDPGGGTLERLRRIGLEACKQSRRTYLPAVHAPAKFDEVIARAGTRWIAHPGGTAVGAMQTADDITLLVGPEGGFTDDEVTHAVARGVLRVALGENILRVETAAVALVAATMLNARTT